MKYKRIYNEIIERARIRVLDTYKESHHIVPKSLGGSDDKDNLVDLTAREHFICHYLLTKFYEKETVEYYKMLNAFVMMKCAGNVHERYINSHLYESLKNHFSKAQSEKQMGEGNSQFGTTWIYNLDLKESKKIPKDDLSQWESNGWVKGRKLSFEPKPTKIKLCKQCGSEECERPNVCVKHQMINTLVNVFGFDDSKKGSVEFYSEFDRVVERLNDEYHLEKLSTIDLSKKYGVSTQRIDSVFKSLGITHRSKSEANKNFKNR